MSKGGASIGTLDDKRELQLGTESMTMRSVNIGKARTARLNLS